MSKMATASKGYTNQKDNQIEDKNDNSEHSIDYPDGDEDNESIDFGKPNPLEIPKQSSAQRYQSTRPQQPRVFIPTGATVQNLEAANNLLIGEINGLLGTLDTQMEKYKNRKQRILEQKYDENIHIQDSDLKEAQQKSTQLKAEIESMK